MRALVVAERSLPFAGRLATAFVELVLAGAVIVGAIVVGHDLRAWRDWYPSAYHPWVEGAPSVPQATEP